MKRLLCTLLTALLLLGMMSAALATDRELVGNVYTTGFPIVEEPVTLRFVAPRPSDFANGYSEMRLFQEYEEMTGVHIEWEEIPLESWDEKVKLMLNANNLPDVFYGTLGTTTAHKYGTEGVLMPLNDLIENYTTNAKHWLEERPDLKKLITAIDGNIYGLPSIDESLSTQVAGMLIMNYDWLEALDLEVPETIDEFTEVLRAFRDNDPNGNGEKDEIALSFRSTDSNNRTTWIGSMFGPFGVVDDETHVMIQDGKVIFTPVQEGFRDALEYFHMLYAEGLLDPESFTQNDSQFFSKARSAEGIGASYAFSYFDMNENNPEYCDYHIIAPLKGEDGNALVNLAVYIAGVAQNRFSITADCENPEVAIRWIDHWLDNGENALTVRFGYEGDSWEWLDDDHNQFTERAETPNGDKVNQAYVSQYTPYTQAVMWELEDLWRKKKNSAPYFIERAEFANGVYRDVAVTEMWPILSFDEATNDLFTTINTDLKSHVENTMATFIINGFDDAQWDAFVKKCEDLRYPELVEIYQQRYDTFME